MKEFERKLFLEPRNNFTRNYTLEKMKQKCMKSNNNLRDAMSGQESQFKTG
jgi:hypothetical protein